MNTTNQTIETSPEQLDRIWQNWNCQVVGCDHIFETYYTYVTRSGQRGKQFEDWLYDMGAVVVQRNRKRFLRFYSSDKAIMFMLQWC